MFMEMREYLQLFRLHLLALVIMCLVSCNGSENDVKPTWDGQWERTIFVPKGIQGRCVDESLSIISKLWYLRTVVHSTYECNQPFLELAYEGNIKEIHIKKNSDDRDIRFQIHDIKLVEMVDVAGEDRAVLSGAAVEGLSSKYVPPEHTFFEQKALIIGNDGKMKADIFEPVLNLAIPEYPKKTRQLTYKKI